MNRRIVVAITGASGAAYAARLVEVLRSAGCELHLTISAAGRDVLKHELGLEVDLDAFAPAMLSSGAADAEHSARLHYHHFRDLMAPVASGSFRTDGMAVCPCSCATLGAIVHGTSVNLIHRAAEVHLKERRRLVLVPRETPLSVLHLENMRRAAEAGAVLLPAMPGFYHRPQTIAELVDFIVGRICDQLGVDHSLSRRWGETTA